MNRVLVITGASSGIGAALARAMAGHWRLVLVARNATTLSQVQNQVQANGGTCLTIAQDLCPATAADQVVAATIRHFGAINALVNNAGQFAIGPAGLSDDAHWEDLFSLNLFAAMRLTRAALPHLTKAGGGTIVNVSSVVAEQTFAGCAAYTASKCALEGWSRVLREELRPQRIRVAVVAPGATDTPALQNSMPSDPRRLCRPEDIAAAIRFVIEQPHSANLDRLVITPPGGAL